MQQATHADYVLQAWQPDLDTLLVQLHTLS